MCEFIEVAVVIITYNGEQWIENCLKSVLETKNLHQRVIVVDNASSDNTVPLIKYGFPEVIVLKQHHNFGFGKANNIGIDYALKVLKPDFIFLLNQDTIVGENTIYELTRSLETNPKCGILSPLHYNDWKTEFDDLFKVYVSSISELQGYTHNKSKMHINSIYEVPFVNAAAWLLKSETVKRVGLFNPIFPHYGEDNDYVFRVQKSGLFVGISPCGYIKHLRNCRKHSPKSVPIAKLIQKKYINALVYLNNVNLNFYKSYIVFFRDQFLLFCKSIVKRDWTTSIITLNIIAKVIGNTISIHNNRSHKLIK